METIEILGEKLLTLEEAGKQLSLTVQTIRQKYRRGELQTVQIGRKFYVPLKSVKKYLEGGAGKRKQWTKQEEGV